MRPGGIYSFVVVDGRVTKEVDADSKEAKAELSKPKTETASSAKPSGPAVLGLSGLG